MLRDTSLRQLEEIDHTSGPYPNPPHFWATLQCFPWLSKRRLLGFRMNVCIAKQGKIMRIVLLRLPLAS